MGIINKKGFIALLTGLLLCISVIALAGAHDLTVIRPGGPSESEQAQLQITNLARQMAQKAGWDQTSTTGHYFNDEAKGLAYIKEAKPGFILASLGFYLKYRDQLGLRVINQAMINGKKTVTYYVVAQKGAIASLDGLKGKALAGVHLQEPEYVERIVFDKKLSLSSDLTIKPMRSLRALRKLSKGEVDAVILDSLEYAGLKDLPFASELGTVFTSAAIPNNGFMTVKGNQTPADVKAFSKAAQDFCGFEDAKAICEDFDIQGFIPIDDGFYATLQNKFKP